MGLSAPNGATLQLWVGRQNGERARAWYERLFGRPPDLQPFDDDSFSEWQFPPGFWEIHVVAQDPPGLQRARFRFGIEDIESERERLEELDVAVSDVEQLPDIVMWCNFEDPWGNRLGLYQDLERSAPRS